MKKIISILLLLSQTSLLLADTLTFKNGLKIEGKVVKINEEHKLDPNTGTTSEVTFKVDKFSINMVPKEMIVGKLNENIFLFDQKSIYKITNDYGQILLIRPFKYGSDGEFIEIPKSDEGAHDELISIDIFDIRGREVDGVVNQFLTKGDYTFTWQASDHRSGLYFIRSMSQSAIISQKVLLLK